MTIQNPQAYLDSIWDWAPLDRCFPRGIKCMDIDGWAEVGGFFLVLEGKAPNVPLKPGTLHTFQRMHYWNKTIPDLFTMVVLWGNAKASRIDRLQFWPQPPFDGGWPQLVEYVRAWVERSEERAAIQDDGGGVFDRERTVMLPAEMESLRPAFARMSQVPVKTNSNNPFRRLTEEDLKETGRIVFGIQYED